jgi:hypothetical protein
MWVSAVFLEPGLASRRLAFASPPVLPPSGAPPLTSAPPRLASQATLLHHLRQPSPLTSVLLFHLVLASAPLRRPESTWTVASTKRSPPLLNVRHASWSLIPMVLGPMNPSGWSRPMRAHAGAARKVLGGCRHLHRQACMGAQSTNSTGRVRETVAHQAMNTVASLERLEGVNRLVKI